MTVRDSMVDFVERMRAGGVARRGLLGCTEEEIDVLETKYSVHLPESYRLFLTYMGHCAGDLARGSPDLLYPAVLNQTQQERQHLRRTEETLQEDLADRRFFYRVSSFLRRLGIPASGKEIPDNVHYRLPEDGLIIFSELSLPFFWMIRCNRDDDSPVYTFDYEGWTIELRKEYESVFDFLEMLYNDALARVSTKTTSNAAQKTVRKPL